MLIWWVPKRLKCKFFQWSCKFFPWCIKERFWSFLEKEHQKCTIFHDFTCLYSSKTQKTHKKNRNRRIDYIVQTKALKSEGRKFGKCEFSIEMWVGPQILEEKICIFGKKLVGPENAEEKKRYLWKKFGGWVPNDTRNKFSAYVPQIFAWSPPGFKGKWWYHWKDSKIFEMLPELSGSLHYWG